MPRSLIWSCCSWFDGVDSYGGWAEVAGGAGLAALFDAVDVVADAFECPRAGAVTAFGDPLSLNACPAGLGYRYR